MGDALMVEGGGEGMFLNLANCWVSRATIIEVVRGIKEIGLKI